MTHEQYEAAKAAGWNEAPLGLIQQYGKKVDFLGWGMHLPTEGLLFYRSTTTRMIHDAFEHPPTRQPTVAFCDGSGMTKDKPAGIGVVIYTRGEHPLYIAEHIGLGTNNVAELRAIWRALQQFPDLGRKLLIRSDSEYAIGSMTKPWNATANAELIANMRADLALREGKVRFDHVDGHAGHLGNEIADALANIGRTIITDVSL
jgi:ribonuclease HI